MDDSDIVMDEALWNKMGSVAGVLLPDGGNAAVNPLEWLAQLQPQMAVISVYAGNLGGLPSVEVIQSLVGTTIL